MPEIFTPGGLRSNDLEDAFFLKEDQKLIEQLRALKKMAETREVLKQISGIHNDAVLDKLVALEIHPEIIATLTLVPLIEVAWADGSIDAKEKEAILKSAEGSDFVKGSIDYTLLEQWLIHKPEPKLLAAWSHFIEGLCQKLSSTEKISLKEEIMQKANAVAEAAGGFLGIGKISEEEKAMLKKLEGSFCK